jgi:hypothetical protein
MSHAQRCPVCNGSGYLPTEHERSRLRRKGTRLACIGIGLLLLASVPLIVREPPNIWLTILGAVPGLCGVAMMEAANR